MTTRVLAALFVLALAAPVHAQDYPAFDVGGGYSLLRTSEENFNGWLASITGNVSPVFGITGEVGGHYQSFTGGDASLHSFLAGPRLAARQNPAITPFVRVLFGVTRYSESFTGDSDFNSTDFAIQPGGGVDFWVNPNFAVRVGADYRRVFFEGQGDNQFLFNVGVGLGGRRR